MSAEDGGSGASLPEEALRDYERARASARREVRERLVARFPEHAEALRAFFEGEDLVAEPLAGNEDLWHEVRVALGRETAASSAPPADEALPCIDGFRLIRRLGEGGMGTVYEAYEEEADRLVALKVMRELWRSNQLLQDMFLREARAAARLSHPAIVGVHRVGTHDAMPYYTMELAAGGTLLDRLGRGPPSVRWTAETLATVAEGVAYQHAQGQLHRDLKPSNILFDAHGRPMVGDFGLALDVAAADAPGRGRAFGTPAFLAPELRGDAPAAPSVRSDVYSLGAVLHDALAGEPPRPATDASGAARVRDTLPPSVPKDLAAVCRKAIHADPARRHEGAGAFARDLRAFLRGQETTARAWSPTTRLAHAVRRRPRATALILALVVLGVSAAVLLGARRDARRQARSLRAATLRSAAATAADAGRLLEAAWLYAESYALEPSRAARVGLRALAQEPPTAILRPGGGTIWRVAFDPQGGRVAAATHAGRVVVWDLETERVLHDLPHDEGPIRALAFSREGNLLATGDAAGVLRLHAMDGDAPAPPRRAPHADLPASTGDAAVHDLAFSPDDGVLWAVGRTGGLRAWDLALDTIEHHPVPGGDGFDGRTLAVGADGAHVLVGGVGRPDTGAGEAEGAAYVFLPEQGRFGPERLRHAGTVWSSAFGPDDAWVATGDDQGVWLHPMDGRSDTARLATDAAVGALARVPGTPLVVVAQSSGHVEFLEGPDARRRGPVLVHGGPVYALACAPDGSLIATGGAEGIVRLWAVPSPRAVGTRHDAPPDLRHLIPGEAGAVLGFDGARSRWMTVDPRGGGSGTTQPATGSILGAGAVAGGWLLVEEQPTGVHAQRVVGLALRPDPPRPQHLALRGPWARAEVRDGGRMLALVGEGARGVVVLLRDEEGTYQVHHDLGRSAAFTSSDDGAWFCRSSEGRRFEIQRTDGPGPAHVATVDGVGAWVALSEDGRRLAAVSVDGASVVLHDVVLDRAVARLSHAELCGLAFLAEGRLLMTAGRDGLVRLWSAETGDPLGAPIHVRRNVGGVAQPAPILAAGRDRAGRSVWAVSARADGARALDLVPLAWLDALDDWEPPPDYLVGARLAAAAVLDEGTLRERPLDDEAWARLRETWVRRGATAPTESPDAAAR